MAALGSFGSAARGTSPTELGPARSVTACREGLAQLLGFSHPERVCFTANVTQALNCALWGLLGEGDHVVATDWDHNSVLRPLHSLAAERGVRVDFAPADALGRLSLADFDHLVTPGTRLVVLTHASNLTGNVLDLAPVVSLAHARGALVLLDAAQTAGCIPLDMEALGVDVLCFTGHKALMGPQGTGGLMVAPHVEVEPLLSGGTGVLSFEETQPRSYPEHLEAGTLNGHGLAGLAAAVGWILETGVDTIQAHDQALLSRLLGGLRESLPEGSMTLYGDFVPGAPHAPVVALNLRGWESSSLADALTGDYGITTRAGAHCAPRMHRALGTQGAGSVRLSFGCFTSEEQIDAAVVALAELATEAL